MILMEEIRDPDLQGFITISEVEVTPDLRRAHVYYRVHGEEEDWRRAERGFRRAHKYIRHLLGEHLYLKYLPEIDFHPDRRPETAAALEALLEGIRHGEHKEDS